MKVILFIERFKYKIVSEQAVSYTHLDVYKRQFVNSVYSNMCQGSIKLLL